jgi:superoxide dismutase, Cu-Zn family
VVIYECLFGTRIAAVNVREEFMKSLIYGIAAAALIGTATYGLSAEPKTLKTNIINAKQQKVGVAILTDTANGTLIKVELTENAPGISPGTHAIHIHEVGKCEPPFKSAGDHFNPLGHEHGFFGKEGKHMGDLPNIHVPKNAPLTVEILVPELSFSSGKTAMLDADGSALVIHQGEDDYRTNPAENAGDRVACAVINKSTKSQ